MTALAAPRPVNPLAIGVDVWRTFPVLADAVIYPGAAVVLTAAGYLKPAVTGTGLRCVGVAAPKRDQMNRDGVVDATSLSDGDVSCEVAGGIVLMKNASTSITIADIGNTCYLVDDQTVTRTDGSTAGTAQVTRGDVAFSGTDAVGVTVDGLDIFVASNTSDDQTVADLVVKWNKHPVAKLMATATADTSGAESWLILTFLDTATHTVVEYSPATAGVVSISNTTAAVAATAATRSAGGQVWHVDARGVFVALGLPS